VVALLAAFSTSNVVVGFVGATIHIRIPEAIGEEVHMYSGTYEDGGTLVAAVVQEAGSLKFPSGQVITRTMELAGVSVTARISMGSANLTNVLAYASVVEVTVQPPERWTITPDSPLLPLYYSQIAMYDLVADDYFVSIGSMEYKNLAISIEVGS